MDGVIRQGQTRSLILIPLRRLPGSPSAGSNASAAAGVRRRTRSASPRLGQDLGRRPATQPDRHGHGPDERTVHPAAGGPHHDLRQAGGDPRTERLR